MRHTEDPEKTARVNAIHEELRSLTEKMHAYRLEERKEQRWIRASDFYGILCRIIPLWEVLEALTGVPATLGPRIRTTTSRWSIEYDYDDLLEYRAADIEMRTLSTRLRALLPSDARIARQLLRAVHLGSFA